MPTTDTKLQQLVINVGTKAQIDAAIAGGTITQDMLSVATDGDTYIQGVKVNGTELTPDQDSKVDITIPDPLPSQTGQSGKFLTTDGTNTSWGTVDLSGKVPYSGATGAVDLNAQDLKNVDNLAVGTATVDSNEKILSVGQNRFVSNNNNGLFISSTTSQTRKGMYGVPMALEIQFNSNNQAYSYPLGFHDMNSNNNGGQFLFTSFSSNIGAATAGDVMVENDKGGLIFNTGNSKSGSKMRFTVGNWQSTPQLTLTANGVGVKTATPNSSYAMDVNGTLNATNILINGQPIDVGGDANVQYTSGGGGTEYIDLSQLYVDSQGATYGFSYDSMSNTIKNDNINIDNSYAYAYIELNLENDGDVVISFSQDSEQNYDFGEISELDQYLNQDNYEDTDYVAWSGKEYSSVSDSITFSNVTAGTHFFTIKYIKDSSSESGTDTFEITGIEISGSSAGSLIDTDTQEEIPLSQLNDMPQALQDIRDEIPDTSNFVTLDTKQMMTAPKAITGTDTPWGSDQVQKNLFMAVSNNNTTPVVEWIGRSMFGANNLTFLMGTINRMAALGAHSWTSAKQGTGAAWADMYFNPDGDKAIKIGGSPMVGRPSIMVIQNMGQTTTGTVKINRRALLTQTALYKDVACWDDNVSKFNNDAGYITGITSAMVTTALGYTPYNSSNPSGYQANVIETVKVNGTALTPTNKEVDITVPTVNNPTITITQGGVSKGSFTLNQSTASTIALDSGGSSFDLLDFKWKDRTISDQNWLLSDSNWKDGTDYSVAYQHLVNDYNNAQSTHYILQGTSPIKYYRDESSDSSFGSHIYAWTSINSTIYTDTQSVQNGDSVYEYPNNVAPTGTISEAGICSDLQTKIGSYTITYYQAQDGHQIVLSDQETIAQNIYDESGTCWFYVLDTTNQRLKLPMMSHHGQVVERINRTNKWLVVYEDGWCEQGGYIESSAVNETVNLLKSYKDTSYTITNGVSSTTNSNTYAPCVAVTKAVGSFSVHVPNTNYKPYWRTCGYVTQSRTNSPYKYLYFYVAG